MEEEGSLGKRRSPSASDVCSSFLLAAVLIASALVLPRNVQGVSGVADFDRSEYYPSDLMIIRVSGWDNTNSGSFTFRLIDSLGYTKLYRAYGAEFFEDECRYGVTASDPPGKWIARLMLSGSTLSTDYAQVRTSTMDTDGDGLTDSYELATYYDSVDSGLPHYTYADRRDSDADGVEDGDEVIDYRSNPLKKDSDSDGLQDGYEVTIGTGLTDSDYDDDGALDGIDKDPKLNLHVSIIFKRYVQIDKPDRNEDGDYYWKFTVTDGAGYSETKGWSGYWKNTPQLSLDWWATFDVPDQADKLSVSIELWDYDTSTSSQQMDISPRPTALTAQLDYYLGSGDWTKDDFVAPVNGLSDSDGIGHVSGKVTGDSQKPDAELWFWILQDDSDGDGLVFWEERFSYNTNPVASTTGDFDGDGLADVYEYQAHSKSDNVDSDGDTLLDCYEWNCQQMSPIDQFDGSRFVNLINRHFLNESKSLKNYSRILSFNYYNSLRWGTDVDLDKFIENNANKREKFELNYAGLYLKLVQSAVKMVYTPYLTPGVTAIWLMEAFLTWGGQELLRYVATQAWSGWNDVQTQWNGITETPMTSPTEWVTWPSCVYGFIYQIGYALNVDGGRGGGESLATRMAELSRLYSTMAALTAKGPACKSTTWLPFAVEALAQFGPELRDSQTVFPSAANGKGTLTITKSDGSTYQGTAFDWNDPKFRYLSDLEIMLFYFGKVLESHISSTDKVTLLGTDEITVGEIARDLTNFAFDTFHWLKRERVLLTSLIEPLPSMPTKPQVGLLRIVTTPAADVKLFVDGVYQGDWGLDWVQYMLGAHQLTFKKGTISVKLPTSWITVVKVNMITTVTVDTKLGKASEVYAPI